MVVDQSCQSIRRFCLGALNSEPVALQYTRFPIPFQASLVAADWLYQSNKEILFASGL